MNKYIITSITFVVLLVLSCKENRRQNKEQSSTDIETYQFPDSSYYQSYNSNDSIWIIALNQIKLPRYVVQDTLNVYFKYDSVINGYEITARWLPWCPNCEAGDIVMNFYNIHTGHRFQYMSKDSIGYSDFYLCNISFSKKFKKHNNGDVYYLTYIPPTYPDMWKNNSINHYTLGYYAPFQFFDIDFDGELELLISDWYQGQQGNNYEAYDIEGCNIKYIDMLPVNQIDNRTLIDSINQKIVVYSHVGCCDFCEVHFSKQNEVFTTSLQLPLLKSESGSYMKMDIEEHYQNSFFSVDSIVELYYDTIYEYKRLGNEIKEKKYYNIRE